MWLALSWPGDRTVLYGSLEQPNPAYWILSVHTKDPCNHNLWSTRETLSYFPVLRAFLGVRRQSLGSGNSTRSGLYKNIVVSSLSSNCVMNCRSVCLFARGWGWDTLKHRAGRQTVDKMHFGWIHTKYTIVAPSCRGCAEVLACLCLLLNIITMKQQKISTFYFSVWLLSSQRCSLSSLTL